MEFLIPTSVNWTLVKIPCCIHYLALTGPTPMEGEHEDALGFWVSVSVRPCVQQF